MRIIAFATTTLLVTLCLLSACSVYTSTGRKSFEQDVPNHLVTTQLGSLYENEKSQPEMCESIFLDENKSTTGDFDEI